MRALAATSYGPIDALRVLDVPLPEPGVGQVRVRVVSSALNPADEKVVTGRVKLLHGRSFPMVVGYDFSGAIDSLGPGVEGLSAGEEVFGFLPYSGKNRQGAFAEYVVASADALAGKPPGVGHDAAAAAATAAITGLQAMRDDGGLGAGGHVLIVGASGGVGSLSVGVAKRLGARVTAVCSAHATAFVRQLGADDVIDRRERDPLAGGGPYDVVFDCAAAHSYSACRGVLGPAGAYVTTLPSLPFVADKLRTMFSARRCTLVMVKPRRADLEQIATWLAAGMAAPVDSRVPVRDVAAAMRRQAQGGLRGRIVIDVAGGF